MSEISNLLLDAMSAVTKAATVIETANKVEEAVKEGEPRQPEQLKLFEGASWNKADEYGSPAGLVGPPSPFIGRPCHACGTPMESPGPDRIGCKKCDASCTSQEYLDYGYSQEVKDQVKKAFEDHKSSEWELEELRKALEDGYKKGLGNLEGKDFDVLTTYGGSAEIYAKEKLSDLQYWAHSMYGKKVTFQPHEEFVNETAPLAFTGEGQMPNSSDWKAPPPYQNLDLLIDTLTGMQIEAELPPHWESILATAKQLKQGALELKEFDPTARPEPGLLKGKEENLFDKMGVQNMVGKVSKLLDMNISPIFNHMQAEKAFGTVEEFNLGPERKTEFVKYFGIVAEGETSDEAALTKLILKLEDTVFHGDPKVNEKDFPGLLALAKTNQEVLGAKSVYGYNEYSEFYKRVNKDKDFYDLKLFTTSQADSFGEGDLPNKTSNIVFAVGRDAVMWRQLGPIVKIKLASLSPQDRYAYMIYGFLQVVDWDALFVYAP